MADELRSWGNSRLQAETLLERARGWAESHGLELIDLHRFERRGSGPTHVEVGVAWTVHVGHGDISADQDPPGAHDSWRWSGPRVDWWRRVLPRRDTPRLVPRRQDDAPLAAVVPLPRARVGVGPLAAGCTCAMGGPFIDICPVHYRPGGNT